MIIKEFISETNRNKMISDLLKYYNVGSVKVKQKSMKDHAHYNVDTGTLELSTRYKTIKKRQTKDFLITIIHEIRHMYEYEMNYQISMGKHQYKDNKYEIEAEDFGQNNWKKWYNIFKKNQLF